METDESQTPQGGPQQHVSSNTQASFHFTISRKGGEGGSNFTVTVFLKSPTTMRRLKKVFTVTIPSNTKNKDFWTLNVVAGAVLAYFKDMSRERLIAVKSKRDLGNGVYRLLKKVTNRAKGTEVLSMFEKEGKEYLAGDGDKPIPFSCGGKRGGEREGEGVMTMMAVLF